MEARARALSSLSLDIEPDLLEGPKDTLGRSVPVHNPDGSWSGVFLLTTGLCSVPAAPALAVALAAARLAAAAASTYQKYLCA